MALNASGTMSVGGSTAGQSINLELFRAATANSNLNESALRSLAGVPAGAISLSNFYGKMNVIPRGYFCGGAWSGASTEIDGVQFSNDTSINPSAALSMLRYGGAGVNSPSKGYIMGGGDNYSNPISDIDGLNFSSETAINPAAGMVSARTGSGVSSSTIGYCLGGERVGVWDEIDGINFSTEAQVNPSSGINTGGWTGNGHGWSSGTHGYAATDYGAVGFVFSTETGLGVLLEWSDSFYQPYSFQSRTHGYVGGGTGSTSDPNPFTHKFSFSTHTKSDLATWTGSAPSQGVDSDVKGYIPMSTTYFTTVLFATEAFGSTSGGLASYREMAGTLQSGWV